MSRTPAAALRYAGCWHGVGAGLVALILWASLWPLPPETQWFAGVDKIEHFLAYAVLVLWWAQVRPRQRMAVLMLACALGTGLEWAQHYVPGRSMDWRDGVANILGAFAGLALARTRVGSLVTWLDRRLQGR